MKLKQYLNEQKEQPTKEMVDFFNKRTKEHIDRVKKNLYIIAEERDDLNKVQLMARAKEHDKSKYSKEEKIPYIWLTWWYKEKNEGRDFKYPNGIEKEIRVATKHHIDFNLHHPQAHKNINDMSDIDIAEMVADWAAMSQELKDDLKAWSNKSIKNFKFNERQIKLINELVELFT